VFVSRIRVAAQTVSTLLVPLTRLRSSRKRSVFLRVVSDPTSTSDSTRQRRPKGFPFEQSEELCDKCGHSRNLNLPRSLVKRFWRGDLDETVSPWVVTPTGEVLTSSVAQE
jgi:hypothetical protein